jgi:phage baseplate assembly protein W
MATNPFFDELSKYEDIVQGPLLSSPTDPLSDITDPKEQVKQNFKILLLTAPGERLTDSNFGVGLKNYLFELANEQTYSKVRNRIQEQTAQYMPYITIQDLRVGLANADSQVMRVIINYFIPRLDQLDQIDLTFPL